MKKILLSIAFVLLTVVYCNACEDPMNPICCCRSISTTPDEFPTRDKVLEAVKPLFTSTQARRDALEAARKQARITDAIIGSWY